MIPVWTKQTAPMGSKTACGSFLRGPRSRHRGFVLRSPDSRMIGWGTSLHSNKCTTCLNSSINSRAFMGPQTCYSPCSGNLEDPGLALSRTSVLKGHKKYTPCGPKSIDPAPERQSVIRRRTYVWQNERGYRAFSGLSVGVLVWTPPSENGLGPRSD